jgi:KRAB domain-containing zinc finger protein
LRHHRKTAHKLTSDFKPTCAECCAMFETEDDLKSHEELHWICTKCGTVSINKEQHERHEKTHFQAKKSSIVRHRLIELAKKARKSQPLQPIDPDKNWLCCELCTYKTELREELEKHISGHVGLFWKFKCDKCDRGYTTLTHLRIHHKNFHKMTELQPICNLCGTIFATDAELKQHTKENHTLCPYCKKTVKHLRMHIRFRHEDKYEKKKAPSVICDICGKKFEHQHFLNVHMTRHFDEYKFFCDFCSFKTKRKATIWNHIRYHLNLFNRKCKICGKKFQSKSSYKEHVKNANCKGDEDVPYFTCMVCGQEFTSQAGLKRHLQMHGGELTEKCDKCESAFAQKYQLFKHKWEAHKEKCYKCKMCGEKFKNSSLCRTHMKNEGHFGGRYRIARVL